MEFAQDATWWFSPLHRMSPIKGVFYCSVYQHWISLMGGKKDLLSAKYWKSMLSLWLLIALMDRVKVIHGVCTGCHLIHHFIECHPTKVFSIVVFASSGFDSQEARRTFILQNIENQCCHCDYWLHWWKVLRLFMEFAQDATWWFSPLHITSPNKGVFYCSVCQHRLLLMGGKKDLDSAKYWKSMWSLRLLIALIKRVKINNGVCTGCQLMVFTTS
jgi:hypothetical protein